jgi:hypothetical protein
MRTTFGPPRPAPDLDGVAVPRHVDARRNGVT